MMGDGHIDFSAPHARCVATAGYRGDVEVEIFNAEVWATPGDDGGGHAGSQRYLELVQPHL